MHSEKLSKPLIDGLESSQLFIIVQPAEMSTEHRHPSSIFGCEVTVIFRYLCMMHILTILEASHVLAHAAFLGRMSSSRAFFSLWLHKYWYARVECEKNSTSGHSK